MFAGGGEEGDLHQYKRAGRDARRIPQRDIRGRLWEIQVRKRLDLSAVLWLRIGFDADPYPDPVFLSQSGSGSKTNAYSSESGS